MTHPKLTVTPFGMNDFQISEADGRMYIAKSVNQPTATRLVACWNACRDMDDPVAEIAKLREGNQSLLQKLSEKDDPYFKNQDGEITRLNNLVDERDRTIARLEEHIERMEEHIETEAQIAAGVHGPVQAEPTPEHLAYQLLRSLILSSAK